MNVLLLTSHAIAEHDDLDMFTRMGVPVYSIGGAYDEDNPFEGKRPAIPNVIRYPELEAATNEQRARMSAEFGDPGGNIDWGKAQLAPEVVDWADTIIVHHFPEQWIGGNWLNIRDKRVIWRTCGQSNPDLERVMSVYVRQGLQVVRYSPKERVAFTAMGAFAGEDAMIRFGKDPAEWTGWIGNEPVVGNITQHMAQRGDACGYPFWEAATEGLPVAPAGPGSEVLRDGIGELTYDGMRGYLRKIRVYLYTGTRPASYTLGLIEAMMTGVPVVTYWGSGQFYPFELWEGAEIVGGLPNGRSPEPPAYGARPSQLANSLVAETVTDAREIITRLLTNPIHAALRGEEQRARAIRLFGFDAIIPQWRDFLSLPVPFGWDDLTPRFAA